MVNTPLTLSELQFSIKAALSERFPLSLWVSAEISELKVNYSGHCYLELIEKGDNHLSRAQVRAVIWRSKFAALSSYFTEETGQPLASGLKVLVRVMVLYHELYGLSLQITDIDPAYTLGDAERERQKCIAQLQKEGVWDMNRSLSLGRLVQRIAVVSSINAAGYQDFCDELHSSGYYFETTLFDAFMQGAGAEDSIVGALEAVVTSSVDFDVVVVIRGGGSSNDLRCFEGYRLASHVAQFPLPIIAGIGHDKDVSVVDMVAFQSVKTPTAVASFLVEHISKIDNWLDSAAITLHSAAVQITHSHHLRLENYMADLRANVKQLLEQEKSKLKNFGESLPTFAAQLIALQRSKLEGMEVAVELYSPQNLLKLGYSVARRGDVAISSVSQVSIGEELSLRVSDGRIVAKVKSIDK